MKVDFKWHRLLRGKTAKLEEMDRADSSRKNHPVTESSVEIVSHPATSKAKQSKWIDQELL